MAPLLWLEVQESAAYRHLDEFTRFCTRLRGIGARVGIEHAGHRPGEMGRLERVGLDYMKIDGALVRGIDGNEANQVLLRTLCGMGQSMGMTMIAEGVRNDAEWNTLRALGMDGVTGPGVTAALSQGNVPAAATPGAAQG